MYQVDLALHYIIDLYENNVFAIIFVLAQFLINCWLHKI